MHNSPFINNPLILFIDRSAIQVEKMSYVDMYELLIFKSQMQQSIKSSKPDNQNVTQVHNELQSSNAVAVEICI